jgi:DNA-binding transcriptional ArsR family regulator
MCKLDGIRVLVCILSHSARYDEQKLLNLIFLRLRAGTMQRVRRATLRVVLCPAGQKTTGNGTKLGRGKAATEGRFFGAARSISLDISFSRDNLTIRLINWMVYHEMSPDRLSTTFAALADPTRRAILARLTSGETTVTELAKPFDMSLPAISKHLKVLEHAGLIVRGRDAQWRPCRLQAGPLKDAADWVERYRSFWEESLDRPDDYLPLLQDKGEAE